MNYCLIKVFCDTLTIVLTDLPEAGEVIAALPLLDVRRGHVVHEVFLLSEDGRNKKTSYMLQYVVRLNHLSVSGSF